MSDTPPSSGVSAGSSFGLAALPQQASDAAAGFVQVREAGVSAADAIDKAFLRAGESLTKSLAHAASDGKVTLAELASALISAVEVFAKAASKGGGGLGDVVSTVITDFLGARADGGPVNPGGAYLVGERGPELFRPSSAGEIAPTGAGSGAVVNVTIAGGGAPQLLRSEAQIAAALARAVALGGR